MRIRSLDQIMNVACETWNLKSYDFFDGLRVATRMTPYRNAIVWVAKNYFGYSSVSLGKYFVRDHTSILHALGRAESSKQCHDLIEELLEAIEYQMAVA